MSWINQRHTILPLASPQVAQTRKYSGEVRIAELRTPYKFPLILALARVTAVSVLEGQGGHSSHRGQHPAACPQSILMRGALCRGREGFPPSYSRHSWAAETLQLMSSCFSLKYRKCIYFYRGVQPQLPFFQFNYANSNVSFKNINASIWILIYPMRTQNLWSILCSL